MTDLTVAIPTRNRPTKLALCLAALEAARKRYPFELLVCDSSTTVEMRTQVSEACARYPNVRLVHHTGRNVSAARNACVRAATTDLIVNVDDDVYVRPDAIAHLATAYLAEDGPRVVAGSVAWGERWSRPLVTRLMGYGRDARRGEEPDFLISAFFLMPRAFGVAWPWNERVFANEDRMMGAVWRANGVRMLFAPDAKAVHDDEHNRYGLQHQEGHIYSLLLDSLILRPRPLRALAYEVLWFGAGVKVYCRDPRSTVRFLRTWYAGHRALIRDRKWLRRYRPGSVQVPRTQTSRPMLTVRAH